MISTTNEWATADHALAYLARADAIPHRTEGEAILLDFVPRDARRILDLGTGDGRLLALLKIERPQAQALALDFSPTMLEAARQRFVNDPTVTVVEHNMDTPLPDLGRFDAIVSSFAIHHCADERKRALYGEIFEALTPGGVFCNLEHVASSSPEMHVRFLQSLGWTPESEDPSNKLLDMETQLGWLRGLGFVDVDCSWKWRELALLVGFKPGQPVEDVFNELPTLDTDRLLLRKITMDDIEDIFEYASDPEVPRYMPWEPHQSLQDTQEYLVRVMKRYQQASSGPWGIVHKADAKLIGTCAIHSWSREHHRAEIGYVLSRKYWGQGYMPEAVRAIIDFGFRTMGLNRIEAFCDLPNIGSARVMEKAGMILEGVLRQHIFEKGTYRDLKLYSILRSEWEE